MTGLFAWLCAVAAVLACVCGWMARRGDRVNERAVVTYAESLCRAAAYDVYGTDSEETEQP